MYVTDYPDFPALKNHPDTPMLRKGDFQFTNNGPLIAQFRTVINGLFNRYEEFPFLRIIHSLGRDYKQYVEILALKAEKPAGISR